MKEVYESKTILTLPMRFVLAAEGLLLLFAFLLPNAWIYFLTTTALLGLLYYYFHKLKHHFEVCPVFVFDENGFELPESVFSSELTRYSWNDIDNLKIFFDHHLFHIQFKCFFEMKNTNHAGFFGFTRPSDFTNEDLKMMCELVAIVQKKVRHVLVTQEVKDKAIIY